MVVEEETTFHFRRRDACLRLAYREPTARWSSDEVVDETLVEDVRERLAHRYPAGRGRAGRARVGRPLRHDARRASDHRPGRATACTSPPASAATASCSRRRSGAPSRRSCSAWSRRSTWRRTGSSASRATRSSPRSSSSRARRRQLGGRARGSGYASRFSRGYEVDQSVRASDGACRRNSASGTRSPARSQPNRQASRSGERVQSARPMRRTHARRSLGWRGRRRFDDGGVLGHDSSARLRRHGPRALATR